jgi:dTDP-4-dehydrorhamnose 3,5-epimerase
MGKLNIIKTKIDGLVVIEATPFIDHRGSFTRFFCADELVSVIGDRKIVQINHSRTHEKGAIRGMHFQYPPKAETKMVRCIRGGIWDVAIDLRTDSPTFLKWYAEELTPENAKMMIVPEGFAHGIQALKEDSELLYAVSEFYSPAAEGGIRYNDPKVNIQWPLQATDLSKKDQEHPLVDKNFKGIQLKK